MTGIPADGAELRTRDRLLDALTVSSGAVDAISFLALGKVFTAFMTGNLVFLGLRIAGAAAPPAVDIGASLAAFAVGVYLAWRVVTPLAADTERWPRQVTVALGLSLPAHAGFCVLWLAVDGQPGARVLPALLALWGLAMGIQSAAIRALRVDAVFTTAATATFIYLASDMLHRPVTAGERRRLAGILVSLIVGATAGAFLLLGARAYAPLLPLAITAGVVAIAARHAPARAARGVVAGGAG